MSPNHEGFPEIKTKWLVLRAPLEGDAPRLLALSHDEEAMRYYGMEPFKSEREALAELAWFTALLADGEGIRWVIADRATNAYMGDIGFHNASPAHRKAEIGFRLERRHWRKGIMSEAIAAVLQYGFGHMKLNRVEALVDPRNAACLALLAKAGFTVEGTLRDYEFEHGAFVDLNMLSLLAREWRDTTAQPDELRGVSRSARVAKHWNKGERYEHRTDRFRWLQWMSEAGQ